MGPSGSGKSTLLGEGHTPDHDLDLHGFKMYEMFHSGFDGSADIISGRKVPQKGRVAYAHQQPTRQFLKRFTGHVEQQGLQVICPDLSLKMYNIFHLFTPCTTCADTLIENFTVFEMLMYTIDLKCSTKLDTADKSKKIDAVIHQLGLQSCRNTLIGSGNSGISGMPQMYKKLFRRGTI